MSKLVSDKEIILASQSSSRLQLLKAAGFNFLEQIPSAIDESVIKKDFQGSFEDLSLELASAKALAISKTRQHAWVIAADQLLIFERKVFDKASSIQEAKNLLKKLRGKQHELLCGHVLARNNEIVWRHISRARLTLRDFSDAVLDDYVEKMGENMLDAVGGYHIEGLAIHLFSEIEGSYFSILGLDLLPLLEALRFYGVLER